MNIRLEDEEKVCSGRPWYTFIHDLYKENTLNFTSDGTVGVCHTLVVMLAPHEDAAPVWQVIRDNRQSVPPGFHHCLHVMEAVVAAQVGWLKAGVNLSCFLQLDDLLCCLRGTVLIISGVETFIQRHKDLLDHTPWQLPPHFETLTPHGRRLTWMVNTKSAKTILVTIVCF